MHKITRVHNVVNLEEEKQLMHNMHNYRDRSFHNSRHNNESILWSNIHQVCRREEDIEERLTAASQLLEFVSKPVHKTVLSRNLDQALNSLLDVFFERSPEDLQQKVTCIFTQICLTLAYDSYTYFQWLSRQLQSIASDNIRNYLLQSLTKLLQQDHDYKYFGKVIGILMEALQTLLENVDVSEHLHICVDPLILISQSYPQVFSKHFRDTVDILVGWHIDRTQSISLIMYCADSLIKLRLHWHADMEFSLLLLNQFLEDMEAYAESMHKSQVNGCYPGEASHSDIPKVVALMRTFSTVVKSIGTLFHTTENSQISDSYILEMLHRVIVCAQLVGDSSCSVLCAANECIQLLIAAVQWKGEEMLSESLLTYVVHGVERSHTEQQLLLVLRLVTVMVQEIGSALPAWFILGLLGPSSRLLPLKYRRNPKISSELLLLYQACLSVKSVSLLQTAYKHVVWELEYALNQLLETKCLSKSAGAICILKDNPFTGSKGHRPNTESVASRKPYARTSTRNHDEQCMLKTALFNVAALSEVADVKNSIIGMYALYPSIFELLHSELLVVHDKLTAYYPTLQYAVLCTLFSHCQRHKQFLSSYLGVIAPTTVGSSKSSPTTVTITHRHYPQILAQISMLLNRKTLTLSSRSLLLHWSLEIMQQIKQTKDSSALLIAEPQFVHFLQALSLSGDNAGSRHTTLVSKCLSTLFSMLNIGASLKSESLLQTHLCGIGLELALAHMCSTKKEVERNSLQLLQSIPLDRIASYGHGSLGTNLLESLVAQTSKSLEQKNCKHSKLEASRLHDSLDAITVRQIWLAKRYHMTKQTPPQGQQENAFHAHHFQSVMERMLKGLIHCKDVQWLERLFWNCHSFNHQHGRQDGNVFSNFNFLYWWAVWECALYTVSNKLRTPLGRPQDTFQKIEGALRDYEQQLSLSVQNSKQSVNLNNLIKVVSNVVNAEKRGMECSIKAVMHRPHLLLQFLDCLEKLMYNAYGGCVSIACPNKAVRTFFSTNRSTCEQWLNRLRLAAIRIALHCGNACVALYHGQKILQDMKLNNKTQGPEFERALFMTVESLLILKSPHAIEGLYKWCREVSRSHHSNLTTSAVKQLWSWLKPAKSQASDCFEEAVKEYLPIYHDLSKKDVTEKNSLSTQLLSTKCFVTQQIANCYLELNNWEDALKWIKESQESAVDSVENFLPDVEYVQALSHFEQEDYKSAEEKCKNVLKTLSSVTLNHSQTNKTDLNVFTAWRRPQLKMASDMNLMLAYMTNNEKNSKLKTSIEKVKIVAEKVTQLVVHYWPVTVDQDFLAIYTIANFIATHGQEENSNVFPMSCNKARKFVNSRILYFLGSPYARENKLIEKEDLFNLRLATCSSARKSRNFQRSLKLLERLTKEFVPGFIVGDSDADITEVEKLFQACKTHQSMSETKSSCFLSIQCELGKVMTSMGRTSDGLLLMTNSLLSRLDSGEEFSASASSILSFVKRLQAEWKTWGPSFQWLLRDAEFKLENELFTKCYLLLNHEKVKPAFDCLQCDSALVEEANSEIFIGTLLRTATVQTPMLAKAWLNSATWFYKWGRKIIDTISNKGSIELMNEEKIQVQNIFAPYNVTSDQLSDVYRVLCQYQTNISDAENSSDIASGSLKQQMKSDSFKVICGRLLSSCGEWLRQLPEAVTHSLIALWQKICARLFAQYHAAAHAYFQFLRLNITNKTFFQHEDSNVIATLRLLRLLAKHALELQATLMDGLAKTPTYPWKGIIPQLFSRLNHPEPYVRISISDLLCRVAKDAAHLIVYPVVVATTRTDRKSRSILYNATCDSLEVEGDQDSQNNEDDNTIDRVAKSVELTDSQESNTLEMSTSMVSSVENAVDVCYNAVLDALKQENSDMVDEVQLLVLELRRITLLWDELWLGTLNQHQHDIMRRLHQLHEEAKRVNLNQSLSKEEKHTILREQQQAIMRPVVYALRRVQRITAITPETPHERWFAENMQPLVDQAMKRLILPPNPQNPNSCWSSFKQLHMQLNNRFSKRSSHFLNLGHISPKLLNLNATSMTIPGVSSDSGKVTIYGCSSVVTILPTKTKPKKLQFIGSDGQRYTYLFKGLEDLHLDERIMQFISITNHLLKRQCDNTCYSARHYSVTPLGARSGLIQWVDGATPLFTLYKRWQQRQALQASTNISLPNQVMRPSELYYSKLNPPMKQAGLDPERVSRKEWPTEILCDVLKELISETPPDLLQRELWCSSTSAENYWDIQKHYSHSTAVMSMIGYVIGLGDRHLDNVLVDLDTGEVVHIDYNVCFEKGAQLRVPERVPFRLTQNIKMALGLTGTEGDFRHACEQVLSTLRKGRETLLTLLEAFVYDPLVDWTGTVEGGYAGAVYGGGGQQNDALGNNKLSKNDMEREITKSLFCSRIAEIKQGWFENRDEMIKTIPDLLEQLQEYKKHFNNHVEISKNIQNFLELKSHAKSAMNDPRHSFNTLKERWMQYKQQQSQRSTTVQAIKEKISVCDSNIKRYKTFLESLQSPELAGLLADVSCPLHLGEPVYESAIPFLNSAGQATMVLQAQTTEKEMDTVSAQCRLALHSCLEALTTYSAIAIQFPPMAVITNHQAALWSVRLSRLLSDFSENECAAIRKELETSNYKDALSSQIRLATAKDSTLQQEVADLNNLLVKLLERRSTQQVQDCAALEKNVNITKDRILNFVSENGYNGMHSVVSILTLALSALGQRGITMESTAAKASHRLVDMTSQDGDWFLEELCSLFGNIVQLLHVGDQILSVSNSQILSLNATQAVTSADKCYRSLMDLYNNFRNIILPEAVKLLQCEESSVIELTNSLNSILQGVKLDDCAKQLMISFRSPNSDSLIIDALEPVGKIQKLYNSLLQDIRQAQEEQRLSTGQMLLQGFDGLFRAVHSSFIDLLHLRNRAQNDVPNRWSSLIDILASPGELQKIRNIDGSYEGVLQALLFVKQLQAMYDFFVLCQSNARSFVVDRQGTSTGSGGAYHSSTKSLYSEERLIKPIKHYIAHFVQELLVGIPSQVLGFTLTNFLTVIGVDVDAEIGTSSVSGNTMFRAEDICKNAVESKYPGTSLAKQRTLIYQFNRAWKELDRMQRIETNVAAVRASLQRAQLQVTRFQWLHEDILMENIHINHGSNTLANLVLPRRSAVLLDLSKRMHTLQQLDSLFKQLKETALSQNKSIMQRLKWAAGANPSLQSVLQEVEKGIERRNEIMKKETTLSASVSELCATALEFEASRIRIYDDSPVPRITGSVNEGVFIQILESCEHICKNMKSVPVKILQHEMNLMNMMGSKNSSSFLVLNDNWIMKVGDQLQSNIVQNKQTRQQEERKMQTIKSKLVNIVNAVKQLLALHNRLLSDVKIHLKTLAKDNKNDEGSKGSDGGLGEGTEDKAGEGKATDLGVASVTEFLERYKEFCNCLNEVLKDVLQGCETSTMSDPDPLLQRLTEISPLVSGIYDSLINLATPLPNKNQSQLSFATALRIGMNISKMSEADDAVRVSDINGGMKMLSIQENGEHRDEADDEAGRGDLNAEEGVSKIADNGGTNSRVSPKKRVQNVTRSGKVIQERNCFGMSVWRRVKAKLDGRDVDSSRRMQVAEQVEYVIAEATSLNNLALLYEGWTAWV